MALQMVLLWDNNFSHICLSMGGCFIFLQCLTEHIHEIHALPVFVSSCLMFINVVCMNHQRLQATMRVSLFRACICSQGHEFFNESTLNLRHPLSYTVLVVGDLSLCMPLVLVVHSTYIIFPKREFIRIRL